MRIEPYDQHNQQLVANVRPPDWVNPRAQGRYHLVVVGAGTAGLVTAAIAAGLGARVALVERRLMGGDCLNFGCVPSKALLSAARAWRAAAEAARMFGGPRVVGTGDFPRVMERMRRLRAGISRIDGAARFRELGVDVYFGEGRFTGRDVLEIGEQQLRFRRAVIATGGRPAGAPVPGLESAGYLTNETIFSLTGLPESLLVLGGGPVGIELAQAFARFGSSVTVVTRHEHILPREDVDAARIVERAMEREGVRFLHRATPARADLREQRRVLSIERDGRVEQVAAQQVLVAVGRMPNVEDLGLEAAGVRADRTGVVVDDRYRTSNRRIFAIGDVSSPYRFTHVADAQARIVVGNALFFGLGGGRASRLVLPWTIYTSPELARVGLTEREAREEGHEVQTITVPLHDVDRAVLETQEDGFFRVHLRKGSDRILGATLIAEHAGEMIGEIALAMTARIGLDRIGATIHPYPTQSEVFRKAADAWRRGKLTPGVKRGFAHFFDMTR